MTGLAKTGWGRHNTSRGRLRAHSRPTASDLETIIGDVRAFSNRVAKVVGSATRCYFVVTLGPTESATDAMAPANSSNTDEFRELSIGPWNVVVAESLAEPFKRATQSLRLDRDGDLAALLGTIRGSSGRGNTAILDLPGTSTRLHIRPLIHGGSLARITGARFLSLDRPLAELRTTAALAKLGAPVPKPGFVAGRRRGWFWQAALASVHVDEAIDGVAFLAAGPDRTTLLRAARAAGSAVRQLHDLGCRHADLHIKNLLIRESTHAGDAIDAIDVIIVDLDRARLGNELTPRRRMLELMRLYRSLHKHGTRDALRPRTLAAFFSAYHRGDRQLRSRLLAHRRFEAWRTSAHTLFYRAR